MLVSDEPADALSEAETEQEKVSRYATQPSETK
jgi:hypothetical protein